MSLLRNRKVLAFLKHLGVVVAGSVVSGLLPLAYNPGVAHASLAQWVALLDHAGVQVLLFMAALVGTPLTRAYGVGSGEPAGPAPGTPVS